MFSPLKYRNFRLLWLGLSVSFTGTFMQQTAILWHVSLVAAPGHKGLALGTVGLVRAVPVIVLSLFAGVAADVFDRRKLMLVTQIGGVIVAGCLAVLAFEGVRTVWPIYVLAACGASVGAFDPPSRQAIVPMLVPREHFPKAVTLNTAMIQAASVIGPAAGGLIIGHLGLGWAYVVNAVSFLFVIGALVMMRDLPAPARDRVARRGDLSIRGAEEGLRFVFRQPMIRSTMLLDFIASFFASAMALLPIYAQDILHVGARGYGWLAAAPATGSMVASLAMLFIAPRLPRQGTALLCAVGVYGLATALFGLSHAFWFAFLCLSLSGAADAVSIVIRNLVRHLQTADDMRGRMTGINMMFYLGGPQLGELEAGTVAQWLGARVSVVSGGIGCIIATCVIAAVTPELRRYRGPAKR